MVADAYEKIENTTKRLEMTDYLVDLLKNTPKDIIDRVVYLTPDKLYPDFLGVEIGIAEKLAIRAVAKATGHSEEKIQKDLEQTGDLGETAQNLLKNRGQTIFFPVPLTVKVVYQTLEKIAKVKGLGSIEQKINLLAELLTDATPKEAKYIIRTVTGKLRLGIADITVLDALAIAYGGGKEPKDDLERAYNISSDLGRVAKTVVVKGMTGIKAFEVSLGAPIRPMLAERLSSAEEILEKLGGRCVAEYKYDGERLQVHKQGGHVTLFSRRLENITHQYPDAIQLVKDHVKVENAIMEVECVAIDVDTGEMKPFQELMHRRRKYNINEMAEKYPVSLFVFEALFVDDRDLTLEPYQIRRKILGDIIKEGERFARVKHILTNDANILEKFFEEAIENGCEGLICKSIHEDAVYQSGARGWLWIKYKRDYKSEMADTVDLVVVAAFHGRGKRGGTYGALLLAAYNDEEDTFETACKCGSGFTDEDLEKIPKMMETHRLPHRHPRVDSELDADVWFEPKVVLEIIGAEYTLSPIHTCAKNVIRRESGLAIRFPRFTGNYRLDKAAEDGTTVKEITEMYKTQLKKIRA